jgi:hypothetical protein
MAVAQREEMVALGAAHQLQDLLLLGQVVVVDLGMALAAEVATVVVVMAEIIVTSKVDMALLILAEAVVHDTVEAVQVS